jgi:hypothetical protein
VKFLNTFADALHAKGKRLSVDLGGCCGWEDTVHPKAPAGHCTGAFSTNEFVATTCAMYKESRIDIVYVGTWKPNRNRNPNPNPNVDPANSKMQLAQ